MCTPRRRATWLAPVLAVLLLATTPSGPASATAVAGPVGATAIEDFPSYQPQERCSPRAKRGTLALAAYLQRRYRGSGSSGISRDCGSGGASEHKEGRAFDWRLDVRRSRDREQAAHFLARVRATDRAGNVAALGRRMGIMYLIWDDRMYAAWDEYRPTRYRHSGCDGRRLRRCPTTLRHRDHVHISLSWRGARGRTSWYVARRG